MFQSLLSWKYNQIGFIFKALVQYLVCFNPCYLGNTIRSLISRILEDKVEEFQSLLSWKYNQITFFTSGDDRSWSVSILVILEIQSDRPQYRYIASIPFSFNPCYLGNTIRSAPPIFLEFLLDKFQSLLSWKYNQICFALITNLPCPFSVSILVILEIQSDRGMVNWFL